MQEIGEEAELYWCAVHILHFAGCLVLVGDIRFHWCAYVGTLLMGLHGCVRFTLGIAHIQKDTIPLKPPVLHQGVSDLHLMGSVSVNVYTMYAFALYVH